MKIKKFKNYEEYVSLQKDKTGNEEKRKKWFSNREENAELFERTFKPYLKFFEEDFVCLCLGARSGEEVLALRNLGFENSLGIDLIESGDGVVIEGDLHDLQYENEIDFIYTNVFDHVLYPEKMLQGIKKSLTDRGLALIQLQLGNSYGDVHGVLDIDDSDEFEELVRKNGFEVILKEAPRHKTPNNHSLNCNFLIR